MMALYTDTMPACSLKINDQGDAVRQLQVQLNRLGAKLTADGWFGPTTDQAVRAAQEKMGLVVDGIAGPKTQQALCAAQSSPILLSMRDLHKAAEQLDVPIACIRTINHVESRGCGFLSDGRPVILFERHTMYRQLKAQGYDAESLSLRYPNIVNKQRGGYAGNTAEHMRLKLAQTIDGTCAIASTSWGCFQIMGYHWERLSYASATAFADAMSTSESLQLDAFVRFIKTDPTLHKALKSRKWAEFARLYNGPAYRDNLYDIKLARTYAQYAQAA